MEGMMKKQMPALQAETSARESYFFDNNDKAGKSEKISFAEITTKRVEMFKNKEPSLEIKAAFEAFLKSQEFKNGMTQIIALAGKFGDEKAISEDERKKLANFAANFNAIVKNEQLFEIFKNNYSKIQTTIEPVFSGNVKAGFERVSEENLIADKERLTLGEKLRLIKMKTMAFAQK